MSWYGARNLMKYSTRIKVINTTTGESHAYLVYMPDGDSKISMNLIYDGPGIYVWELISGGRIVAKAPYSTPLGIDTAEAVSQDGLPVLRPLANKDLALTYLEGIDPNGVGASDLGEEITDTPVLADDVSDYEFVDPYAEDANKGKGKTLIIIGVIGLLIVFIGLAVFFFIKKRREGIKPPTPEFVTYAEGSDVDSQLKDVSEFEEVK